MRFLKANTSRELYLTKDLETPPAPYAILSHTWGSDDDEVKYHDVQSKLGIHKTGYNKLQFCAKQAERDRLEYFWVDTCCIDKANLVELSEAITSMFRWYQGAAKCYVYLSDVSVKNTSEKNMRQAWKAAFRSSRWFTRGWTLQELLAPRLVEFFSQEGVCLGDKQTLEGLIQEITSIPTGALQGVPLSKFTFEERLQWAEGRHTKKVEDKAYCLLGILDVSMSLRYGERENAYTRLRRKIETYTAATSPSAVIPFDRDIDFVERGTLLNQIHKQCMIPGSWTALVGLGSVGKSQFAIEYAYRSRESSPTTWIFWVHASNTARLEQSYREIANCVQIPGRQNRESNIFQLVHDWLQDERKGRWVLILDNADDTDFLFDPHGQRHDGIASQFNINLRPLILYIPRCPHGSVLVTTRTQQAALRLAERRNIIDIQPMSEADAITLFKKKLVQPHDENSALELAAALDYMPLAIVQAAAYISQRTPRCSIKQYLEEFQKSDRKRTSLLSCEGGQRRRDVEAKNSIIITWQISFDRVREIQRSAADLLALMSFFDRQGIPEVLLHQRMAAASKPRLTYKADSTHNANQVSIDVDGSSTDDEHSTDGNDELEDDIAILSSYSFIAATTNRMGFRMHRLVQLATQKWLELNGQKEKWKQTSVRILNTTFPNGNFENWKRCQLLFPHVKLAAAAKPKEYTSLVQWSSLLYKASWYRYLQNERSLAGRAAAHPSGSLLALASADWWLGIAVPDTLLPIIAFILSTLCRRYEAKLS